MRLWSERAQVPFVSLQEGSDPASVLISIATSYKLPLSTTYVTFMVAMGTSLADRAWGAEDTYAYKRHG